MQRVPFLLLALGCASSVGSAEERVDFETQVAPILAEHCIRCHSAGNKKGEMSLATFGDLQSNEYVNTGDPDDSYLLQLVTAQDGKRPEMPKDAEPLSDEQVVLFRRWISEGAEWPDDVVVKEKARADASWWSLQPLKMSTTSSESATLDEFIQAKLSEHNLTLNPPADH